MFEFVTARELFELVQVGSEIEKDQLEYVELDGWVRTNRNNGSVGFIELNDGTYFKNVQLVYNKGDESYDTCASLNTGDAVNAFGVFKITEGGRQPFEIVLKKFEIMGKKTKFFRSKNLGMTRKKDLIILSLSSPFIFFSFHQATPFPAPFLVAFPCPLEPQRVQLRPCRTRFLYCQASCLDVFSFQCHYNHKTYQFALPHLAPQD